MKFYSTYFAVIVIVASFMAQSLNAASFAKIQPGELVIGSDLIIIGQPSKIDIQGGEVTFRLARQTPRAHWYPQDCLKGNCPALVKVKTNFNAPIGAAAGISYPDSVTGYYLLFLTAIDKSNPSKGYKPYQDLYGIYSIISKEGKSGLDYPSYQRRFGLDSNPTRPVEDSRESITLEGFINYLKFNWKEQFNK